MVEIIRAIVLEASYRTFVEVTGFPMPRAKFYVKLRDAVRLEHLKGVMQ